VSKLIVDSYSASS